jgi:ubiquinone/menaquinone biosynthesis C-methylase UbiE
VLIPLLREALGSSGEVVAVDVSPGMLREAERQYGGAGVRFVQADAADLDEPAASFDVAFCNSVLPHFDDPAAALAHLASLLRPGGTLVICHSRPREAVNAIHAGGPPAIGHDRLPPGDAVAKLLQAAGLEVDAVEDTAAYYFLRAHRPPTALDEPARH